MKALPKDLAGCHKNLDVPVGTVTMSTLRQFAADSRGATALEYGIIGGVVAFLAGAVFLHVAPSLADMAAYAVRSLSGATPAG